jgi:predicted transcriptional regulator
MSVLKTQFAAKANMKKRDRTEIIAAILEITSNGYRATNTKIIYQSAL